MQRRWVQIIHTLFILLALSIILDFAWPGANYTDKVIDVEKELQQYYNAARNYHYSYRILTTNYRFSVSEEFAQTVQEGQEIQYQVSLLFKEINGYGLITSESKSLYSLRVLSGLVVPLLAIIILVLGFKYADNMSILIFVIQISLVADLIFLII